MRVSFGRTTQNSFPSGSDSTVHDSPPLCPRPSASAEGKDFGPISASRSSAVEVRSRCRRFLTTLRSVTGMKQIPTGAVVRPDHDLPLPLGQDPPAQHLGPEPGQGGQVVGVDDDVMQRDRHAEQRPR